MKLSTLKIILNMFNSASKDVTRHHICGVNIRAVGKDSVRIQATDGFMASFCVVEDAILNKHLGSEENFVLHNGKAKMIKAFIQTFPRHSDGAEMLIKDNNLVSPYGPTISFTSELVVNYPKVETFVPNYDNKEDLKGKTITVGINPKLIERAVASFGIKKEGLRITMCSEVLAPITLEANVDGVKFTSVIMPLRG